MSRFVLIGWLALSALAASAADFHDLCWRKPFCDVERWTAQPTWLSNASPTASAAATSRCDGPDALISLEIGPHGVGCLIVEHKPGPAGGA